jgi:3-hydroxyacyl-[acyl-carrier-protein] dehydratase
MNHPSQTTLEAALASLPHGPEFRFVDRLITLVPGQEAVGEYRVKPDSDFLRGHFPGQPLLPGVLLLEAVAQLAGIAAQTDPHIKPLKGLKLTAIRSVKITGAAFPGDAIRLEARLLGRMGGLVQAAGKATVNNQQLLHAEVTLSGEFEVQP